MLMIGCDFHTRFQRIPMLDTTTGEITERRLPHERGEAKAFYAALPSPARVGMEATGHAPWFERMLVKQGHELWVGNPALIRAAVVRKQKTALQSDAELRRHYQRLKFRRGSEVAKVAIARKLAVRLYGRLREAVPPVPPARMQGSSRISVVDLSPSTN